MNGTNERQHLTVRQPLAIRNAATLPGPIPADADIQAFTHLRQRKRMRLVRQSRRTSQCIFHEVRRRFFYYFKLPFEPVIFCSQSR